MDVPKVPPIISILQMVVHYSMHLVVLTLPNGHDGTELTYSITFAHMHRQFSGEKLAVECGNQ